MYISIKMTTLASATGYSTNIQNRHIPDKSRHVKKTLNTLFALAYYFVIHDRYRSLTPKVCIAKTASLSLC